jgi:YidC/Oxa1 family membrane protein insertase
MDRRSLFALLLIFIVIVGGTMLRDVIWPPAPAPADSLAIDSTRGAAMASDTGRRAAAAATPRDTVATPRTMGASTAATSPAPVVRQETTTVAATGRQMQFVSPGAAPTSITLTDYRDLKRRSGLVSLRPNEGALLGYRIVNGADTIHLDRIAFTRTESPHSVEFVSATPAIRVRYDADSANYLTHVSLSLAGAAPNAQLLVDLAPDLTSGEADEKEDVRSLAYGFRPSKNDVVSVHLPKLDSTYRVEQGPIEWVAIRNKYFVVAVLSSDSTHEFSGFQMKRGAVRPDGRPTGIATASLPLAAGSARFQLYTGPQSWKILRAVGRELSNVNPYAGWAWLRPVVEPFSTIVMRMLLGMKALVGLSYGWVLVIFGILIRLLLWPMNQTAMRTSIKMQALQPELTALQKRYAKDPEGQRTAMMKLYAEHGMSPFSPLMGCLPMLIPMPILMALYFVFQNTIEFRGVSFFWLPDISMKDPYYITPIVMGVSMLVLSLIGMRAGPPNPQAKMMGYMMPAMMTIIFLNFASGLNLYYAVQNLVAIPQQWFLTRERAKASATTVVKGAPAVRQRK